MLMKSGKAMMANIPHETNLGVYFIIFWVGLGNMNPP